MINLPGALMRQCEIVHDEQGEVIAVVHGGEPLTAQGRVALAEIIAAARRHMEAEDPDGLLGDRQQRALDRLHKRETPECGDRHGDHICTRPAGHIPRIHIAACGTQRWGLP